MSRAWSHRDASHAMKRVPWSGPRYADDRVYECPRAAMTSSHTPRALKTMEVYSPGSGVQKPKMKVLAGPPCSSGSRKSPSCLFQLPVAAGDPPRSSACGYVTPALPLSSHGLLPCVTVSLSTFLSSYKFSSHRIRTHASPL